jgi:hypothetical protein
MRFQFHLGWPLLATALLASGAVRWRGGLFVAAADNLRVLTSAELQTATGETEESPLYLALLGRVYDVSAGRDYYGLEGPYHIFAGRDAPVPFVTGVFDENEGDKPWTDLPLNQHAGLLSWVDFYETESKEKYPCVGVVEGAFYNAQGLPTAARDEVYAALAVAKVEQQAKDEERKRKRAARDAKKKREQQEQQEAWKRAKDDEL